MKKQLLILAALFATITGFAQLPNKAEDISPLLIGEKVPEVEITALSGSAVHLTEQVKAKRAVVIFYRGGWCPFCNRHLAAVSEQMEEIQKMGYQVIGISPDDASELKKTVEGNTLNYQLYSDGDGSLAKALGIAFEAPTRYQPMLGKYSDGKNNGYLPVPSLFVVDTDGTILFEYISPNYKQRMSSDLLLAVLKQLTPAE